MNGAAAPTSFPSLLRDVRMFLLIKYLHSQLSLNYKEDLPQGESQSRETEASLFVADWFQS